MADKASRVIDETTPLMVLAGPMFLEQFLNILVNNIDTLMLSHYSELAVGAVGNVNQIMMFMILTFNIIATATSVVVAQYLGAKKYDKMNMIYTLSFIVNFVFGVVLSGGLAALGRVVYTAVHLPGEMMTDALTYNAIVGGGLFLLACYNVMLQILRCNGHAKVGMYISFAINFVNIVGNYMFLYGPLAHLNMGVAGVAISTVASRVVALAAALVFFYRQKIGRIALRFIRPFPTKMLVEMLKIGLPSAGENMSYNMVQIVLLSFINTLGATAVNANAYCRSLTSFVMVFSNMSALATQIITGHLVGAGKEDAAYKRVFKTLKLTLPITMGLSVVNLLLSPYTLRFFTQNEEIIHMAYYVLAIDLIIEIGRCFNMTFASSLKSAGDYYFPLIVGLICMWGLQVTVAYGVGIAAGFGIAGVWFGTATDELIRGTINMNHWYRKKWYGKSIVKKQIDID